MIKRNFIPYRAQNKVLSHIKWPVWNSKCFLICSGINTCWKIDMWNRTAARQKADHRETVVEQDGGVPEETGLCSNYFQKCHHYSFISPHVGETVFSGTPF